MEAFLRLGPFVPDVDAGRSLSRRPSLLPRAVSCDAPLRLSLRNTGRMAHHQGVKGLSRRWSQYIGVRGGSSLWTARTLLGQSVELWCVPIGIAVWRAHCASMLAVPPAAGRKTRISIRSQNQERRSESKAEDGQQQNGQEFAQCLVIVKDVLLMPATVRCCATKGLWP